MAHQDISYEEFASDVTSGQSVRIHSIEETEETLKSLGVSSFEMRQLGRGTSRTDLAAILSPEGLALSHRFERSFYSPLHTPDEMVTLLITSAVNGDLYANGTVISDGKLLVQTPDTEIDIFAPDIAGSDAFGVPVSRFYPLVETICPGSPAIRPGDIAMVQGDTARLQHLSRAINALVTNPESDPQHERQANLIAEIIAWIGDSGSQWEPEGFSVNGERIRIALKAREYMEDNFPNPILMENVCREIGVSLRTLQRAFAEYYQIPPYDFLKKLRLDRARRRLVAGDPETDSVTRIAKDSGFSHLSRFSKDYNETFGELPRETLARS